MSASQWFEFVQAYAPYYTGSRTDPGFTSLWIEASSLNPNEPPGYRLVPRAENYPVAMSWHMAARYCNWLCNDKSPAREAFETGAYDVSTFSQNPDGTHNDQAVRTPGARYWIPSVDEWIKAAFYDPNRYGPGQEGYWTYPNTTNSPLVPGFPQDGGQTLVGVQYMGQNPNAVGAYASVISPWGLWDISGGEREWTESLTGWQVDRFVLGSNNFADNFGRTDSLEGAVSASAPGFHAGIRIASAESSGNWCRADWDGNHAIEPQDVSLLVNQWYADLNNGTGLADFDGNNVVQPADVSAFMAVWFRELTAGGC